MRWLFPMESSGTNVLVASVRFGSGRLVRINLNLHDGVLCENDIAAS